MALTITDQIMRSTDTRHTAELTFPAGDGWHVTWLPGRALDRNQAVTAMTIAEIASGVPAEGDPADYYTPEKWALLDTLAAELGMSGPNAVSHASESPEDGAARAAEEAGR